MDVGQDEDGEMRSAITDILAMNNKLRRALNSKETEVKELLEANKQLKMQLAQMQQNATQETAHLRKVRSFAPRD